MLCVPCVLVFHNTLLPFPKHFEDQGGNKWLVPKFMDGCKQGLEVEHNSSRKWQTPECLPVDTQVAPVKSERWLLGFAVFFVRVAWRHVEWFVNFQTPGTSLNGFIGGLLGKVPASYLALNNTTTQSQYHKAIGIDLPEPSGQSCLLTYPLRIASFLCSLGLVHESRAAAFQFLTLRSTLVRYISHRHGSGRNPSRDFEALLQSLRECG
jgi:hypothetical protein